MVVHVYCVCYALRDGWWLCVRVCHCVCDGCWRWLLWWLLCVWSCVCEVVCVKLCVWWLLCVYLTPYLDAQLKWDLVVTSKGGCKHLRGAVDEKDEAVLETCVPLSRGGGERRSSVWMHWVSTPLCSPDQNKNVCWCTKSFAVICEVLMLSMENEQLL